MSIWMSVSRRIDRTGDGWLTEAQIVEESAVQKQNLGHANFWNYWAG